VGNAPIVLSCRNRAFALASCVANHKLLRIPSSFGTIQDCRQSCSQKKLVGDLFGCVNKLLATVVEVHELFSKIFPMKKLQAGRPRPGTLTPPPVHRTPLPLRSSIGDHKSRGHHGILLNPTHLGNGDLRAQQKVVMPANQIARMWRLSCAAGADRREDENNTPNRVRFNVSICLHCTKKLRKHNRLLLCFL
jgi:hypothetical protein